MASQRRIQCDEFSRNVSQHRSFEDYEKALSQMQINSKSRSLSKRQVEERRELELIEKIDRAEEEKRQRDEKERILQEIAREEMAKNREKFNDKKMRQQVRENNQELRQLESKLRMAYVLKGLEMQKKEKLAFQTAENIQKQEELRQFEEDQRKHLEAIKKAQEINKEKKRQLREDLKSQIISAHQQHQILYEQFLKEKAYLDEIVVRVQQELFEEASRKIKAKEQSKRDMEAFRVAKAEMERLRSIDIEEENKRIFKYCQERDRKIQEEEMRRRELEQHREALNGAMVKELTELNDKKLERERLLQELWAFEQNEKIEEKIRSHMEHRLRMAVESRLALEQQLEVQRKRKEQDEMDEKVFYENQLQLLAERDKLEQLSNEKRRRKMAEHRRDVQEMLSERKLKRAEALALELKARDAEQQAEKRRQEIIEEERIKIIQEHAESLIGFLPSEILRESDNMNFSFAAAALRGNK